MSDERGNEMQTIYTHDEMGTRVDVHRPSAINPGDYEYIKVDEARKALKEGQKIAGPGGVCHHCGKAIVWRVHFRYIPTGDVVTFGYICTEILEMSDNRIDHEMVLLKRQAANERREEALKMEREDRVRKFAAEQPALVKFLNEVDDNESFYFLKSLAQSFERWGSLTERQTEAAVKIMKQREEYLARKLQAAIDEANAPEAEDLEEGRYVIEGVVIKEEIKYSDFGSRQVMTVMTDGGNKVWGTVPRDIAYSDKIQNDGDLKGKRVRFTATVEKSDRDDHFGFFSRPAKAEIL